MLTMYGNGMLIIGVTKENLTRLQDEKPILHHTPRPLPLKSFVILYGETKLDLVRQLEAVGMTLPEDLKAEVERDPT